MEALLRWRHPERGLLQPDDFIPVAEQSDLIHSLGRRVLGDACRQAVRWQRHGRPIRIAVNLSARQFRPGLAEEVAVALDQSGLDPHCLTLEITETVVLQDCPETLGILHELKHLGVGIATDDFGTGYTSLEQLRHYPLDVLKIDQSFVRGLARRQEDELIVAAMISLAHDLGLQVVAEGVETHAQRELLRSFECDAAQGFLFAEPLPEETADAYLADHVRTGV
jgi:EAL domain-containing protein (putative c-di-GMP-specific phosphodiesterase class I)